MVITLSEAKALALRAINVESRSPVAILDECTIERDFGWVLFYDSVEFILHHVMSAKLVGNSPIIVNRYSGKVSRTDTALPTSAYVAAYEALGVERYDQGEWRDFVATWFSSDDDA